MSRSRFAAEAAYAHSIFRQALGDTVDSIASIERALEHDPAYGPALLSLGSVEYQRGRNAAGRELFHSLLALPPDTPELAEILDKAGDFLIDIQAYADGLELLRAATRSFPDETSLHCGLSCCAGHEGLHDEAIRAAKRAVELEPESPQHLSDLGWCLYEAGRLREAEQLLARAVDMDPSDELARNNLRICRERASGAMKG